MYSDFILEHAKHPHNFGETKGTPVTVFNPLCGDTLTLFIQEKDGLLEKVSFIGSCCALALASTSLLTDYAQSKKVEDVKILTPNDIYTLLGTTVSPLRAKCCTLALDALHEFTKASK